MKLYENKEFNMSPPDLAIMLQEKYISPIPVSIENIEELQAAGGMLGELANAYAYLMSMATLSRLLVREKKKNDASKDEINDAIDRREIYDRTADVVKMQYNGLSRMITVRKQAEEEIRMSGSTI